MRLRERIQELFFRPPPDQKNDVQEIEHTVRVVEELADERRRQFREQRRQILRILKHDRRLITRRNPT